MVKIRNKIRGNTTILSNALAVSFDNHIGHDYIDDMKQDLNFITRKKKDLSLI